MMSLWRKTKQRLKITQMNKENISTVIEDEIIEGKVSANNESITEGDLITQK